MQAHAEVVVRSSYLSADDLASAHLGHTDDVAETVLRRLHDAGPESRVCVLPEGPQTIPYVACTGRPRRPGRVFCPEDDERP